MHSLEKKETTKFQMLSRCTERRKLPVMYMIETHSNQTFILSNTRDDAFFPPETLVRGILAETKKSDMIYRDMEAHLAKQFSREKMIAPAKKTLVVKDEENPMLGNSDDKPLNRTKEPLCTDGPSSRILNVGKKESVRVPVSLPPSKVVRIPLSREDSLKRGETSPVTGNLSAEFEGNFLYSDNMPQNGTRKPLPKSELSIKFLDKGKNESVPVPFSSPRFKAAPNPVSRGNSSRTGENPKVKFISAGEVAVMLSGAKKLQHTRGSSGTVPSVANSTCSSVPATEASKAGLRKGNSDSIFGTPGFSKHVTFGDNPDTILAIPPGYNKHVTSRNGESPSVKVPQESHIERPPSRVGKTFTSERLKGIDEKLFIPQPVAVKSIPRSSKVLSQPNGRSVDREAYISPAKRARFSELKYNGEAALSMSNNEDFMLTKNNASGKAAASASGELSIKKEQPTNALVPSMEITKSSPLVGGNAVGASFTDGQFRNSDVQESVSPPILSEFSKGKFENILGPDALWKGSFEICDEFCHTDFYEEIEAHRPIIVSPKVCEVSKQMPKKLPFKLISRLDVWPRIFLKGCPTANDIALYFLPREVYSSRKKYIDLLELIQMDDLAMQSYLGGVELLIFTSKQLPVDSQRLNMKLYLWGVFRHVKDTKLTYLEGGLSSIPTPGPGNLQEDHAKRLEDGYCNKLNFTLVDNDAEEGDMEIDMIGGKDIGRIDKPVPRPVTFKSRESSESYIHSKRRRVSYPQNVSSNSRSSLRPQILRFSNDTSTSNIGKTTNTQVLNATLNVLSSTNDEKEIEKHGVTWSASSVTRNTPSGSQHLIRQCQHGPYDGSIRPPSSGKANRLELDDYYIPTVPPGFSKLSTGVASQEKSLMKPSCQPTTQKIVDVPTHFSKANSSKYEYYSSMYANNTEKAIARGTDLQIPSNMPIARDMDVSPGFMMQPGYKDKFCSSEAICKNEKDEYRSFDATSKQDKDDITPGFTKKLYCENGSLKVSCLKEKDECCSSEAQSKNGEGECHPFAALFEREKDESNSSESTDRNKKATVGSTGAGNQLKDAGVERASSKGQELFLQSEKSIIDAESPQVQLTYHEVLHHNFELHVRTDSTAHSMAAIPARLDSHFHSGGTSCLRLFPLKVESTTQEIEMEGTHNDLVLGTAQCAKDNGPMTGEESLVLSLSRPDYTNDGNNWITVLSKERLQQDGCGEELHLTL